MILTKKDIERLIGNGVTFIGTNGEPIMPEPPPKPEPPKPPPEPPPIPKGADDSEYFQRIIELLGRILYKPEREQPKIEPPIVTVEPTPVVVQPAPIQHMPKPIRKWQFTLKKDNRGQTTEITATALE